MGKIKKPDLVNYVIHVFTSGNSDFWLKEYGVLDRIKEKFGEIDYISEPIDFQKFTSYYNREMGENIKIEGRMVSLKYLGSQSFLADAKNITNEIEKEFAIDGSRKVNLDVGYIHHTQFVLASTKHWGNRIYLRNGIYAEITLMYMFGEWQHHDYSYENFKDKEYKDELEKIRSNYMIKRRNI